MCMRNLCGKHTVWIGLHDPNAYSIVIIRFLGLISRISLHIGFNKLRYTANDLALLQRNQNQEWQQISRNKILWVLFYLWLEGRYYILLRNSKIPPSSQEMPCKCSSLNKESTVFAVMPRFTSWARAFSGSVITMSTSTITRVHTVISPKHVLFTFYSRKQHISNTSYVIP